MFLFRCSGCSVATCKLNLCQLVEFHMNCCFGKYTGKGKYWLGQDGKVLFCKQISARPLIFTVLLLFACNFIQMSVLFLSARSWDLLQRVRFSWWCIVGHVSSSHMSVVSKCSGSYTTTKILPCIFKMVGLHFKNKQKWFQKD